MLRLELVHRDVVDLELDRPAGLDPRRDQVLHDLLLPVDRDVTARELAQVDAVTGALELELEPVVGEPLLVQACADADLGQQLDGPVLEDARAHAALDVLPAAGLEHDGVDPLQVEELRQHETGRAGAHDRDLGARRAHPSRSKRAA